MRPDIKAAKAQALSGSKLLDTLIVFFSNLFGKLSKKETAD